MNSEREKILHKGSYRCCMKTGFIINQSSCMMYQHARECSFRGWLKIVNSRLKDQFLSPSLPLQNPVYLCMCAIIHQLQYGFKIKNPRLDRLDPCNRFRPCAGARPSLVHALCSFKTLVCLH
ncbi:hypothetical protein DM860_008830 [Cuscuta australis]|uniref:Uncharacterized protein n=1 Tax=Cuscuta australis TaxID=267555 RepID=A0A328DB14_9ASTE|nr:hypothetical protein DM860_008830 [Cuscuta australis]